VSESITKKTPVIVVNIQYVIKVSRVPCYSLTVLRYRLQAFGFLDSTELRNAQAAAGDTVLGNYGKSSSYGVITCKFANSHLEALNDIDLGIEWVHKYISDFGGDPSKITIFGESAGVSNMYIIPFLFLSCNTSRVS
jgi:Carboxylesterase family